MLTSKETIINILSRMISKESFHEMVNDESWEYMANINEICPREICHCKNGLCRDSIEKSLINEILEPWLNELTEDEYKEVYNILCERWCVKV